MTGDKGTGRQGKNCSLLILHQSLKKGGEPNDKSKINNEQLTILPLSICLLVSLSLALCLCGQSPGRRPPES
jgi:hypothetical protein